MCTMPISVFHSCACNMECGIRSLLPKMVIVLILNFGGTEIFRFNQVNIMVADALADCVARISAPMVTRKFLCPRVQLPVSCQCGGKIHIVDTVLCFP